MLQGSDQIAFLKHRRAGTLYKINSNEMDRGEIRTDVKEL